MKDSLRNSLPNRRSGDDQAGLSFFSFLSGDGRLHLLDQRLHRVDGGAIPFMPPFGLACSSNGRFVNSRHWILLRENELVT